MDLRSVDSWMRKVDLKTSVQDWAAFQPSTPTFDMVRKSKTGYEFLYVVADSDSKPTKDEDDEFMKETWAGVAGATLVQPGWYRRESVVIAYARYVRVLHGFSSTDELMIIAMR